MTELNILVKRPVQPWLGLLLGSAAIGVAAGAAVGAPIWLVGLIGLAPLLPLLAVGAMLTARMADGWLALYLVLAVTQAGHVGEHVVQVVQLRVLGLDGAHAHGIFGALDIEWVHFAWNAWILVAVGLLLVRFRRNPWLWVTMPLAAWHLGEHAVLIAIYVASGTPGNPGLLAMGGLLGGGLPVARPELHLAYNLAETVPLLIGLGWQWRRWIQAPPSLPAGAAGSDAEPGPGAQAVSARRRAGPGGNG